MDGSHFPRRFRSSLFVALSALALPGIAADESDLWSSLGLPSGGTVTRLLMDPAHSTTLYALAPDRGIYKTTDGGGSWTLIYSSTYVFQMTLDPLDPATLYFTEDNGALFKSSDSGASWHESDTGLPVSGEPDANAFIDNVPPLLVAADPVNAGVLYTVAQGNKVYKSVDGGQHWNASSTGIDPASANDLQQGGVGIESLIVDPVNPQVLYLSAFSSRDVVTGLPGMALAGVYQSTDGGAHWNQVLSGEDVWSVAIQPGNDRALFASGNTHFFTSSDGGAHWASTSAPNSPIGANAFCFDPADPQHMWAANDYQTYASADGGATWTEPTTDYFQYAASDLLADPNDGTLYAASGGYGVGKSVDGGATWAPADAGIHDVYPSQMMVTHDGALWVGTQANGMFRSADAGADWTPADGGIFSGSQTPVKQMAEDPVSGTLFMVNGYIFRSQDGGDNWDRVIEPLSGGYAAIAITPGSPSTVYVAQMAGVHKSTDDGDHWSAVNTGLPVHSDSIAALASSPVDADKAFAGSGDHGLYMTSDGGAHWAHVDGLDASGILALAIDPGHADTVFASLQAGGLFKSADGGATWSDSGDGMDGDTIALITIDPADGDDLVAMSETPGRVYLSADGGASWTRLDTSSSSLAQAFKPAAASGSAMPVGPSLASLVMDTKHKGMMYAADREGKLYKVSVADLVANLKAASSASASSSGSGGGQLPLCLDLLLLGALLLRRR